MQSNRVKFAGVVVGVEQVGSLENVKCMLFMVRSRNFSYLERT